jgi:hypothetical protein
MMSFLLACPMCFGAADSGQVQAAKIGVLVLLACIVPILVAIAFTARSWARRARALDEAQQPARQWTAPPKINQEPAQA